MAKQRVDKEKIGLEVTLPPVIVTVEKGATDKETIERAEKAVLEVLMKKFPKSNFSIVELGVLNFDTIKVGMLVEEARSPKNKGIVTGINKKTVNVTLTGSRNVQGPPTLFRLTDAPFEKVGSFYKKAELTHTTPEGVTLETYSVDYFSEGVAGYLNINANESIPVVVGKSTGSKFNVYPVVEELYGKYYTLDEDKMKKFFTGKK